METQTRTEARGAAMLSEETRKTIDHWVAKFPDDKKRSALIQSLIAAQEQNGGWITPELAEAVAAYLELPPVWAHEVVSFYSMFFTEPVGRHKVNICTNISCWLNGADRMVEHAEKKLGVKPGDQIIPISDFTILGNPKTYAAKAWDDRIGVAAVIRAEAPPELVHAACRVTTRVLDGTREQSTATGHSH